MTEPKKKPEPAEPEAQPEQAAPAAKITVVPNVKVGGLQLGEASVVDDSEEWQALALAGKVRIIG